MLKELEKKSKKIKAGIPINDTINISWKIKYVLIKTFFFLKKKKKKKKKKSYLK